ncbi:MAG: UDP-N-acetylmuramate dehydrogenase [Lachnospiraceae bacterium]|uniref:UDP-N-acetylmuramate dehydrogenase n=1 Tax=Blautia faecicola TaxID=2509240 RepID=UPI00259358D5|nr:UDP-N-acetylmuramate dehydrogenase [uncultured Blautia sp.]MEE1417509.1 UDP-N-acetylmuramate dehydrogenase [Lachnospiraceae bacterium]
MREEIIKRLEQTVESDRFLREEPMKKHITFRVGGPAACFLTPSTKEQIREILHICQEEKTPYFILGNGSNLLVSDQGFDGVVLQVYKNMNQVTVEGEHLRVQAGALLSATARKALEAGLTGMEFAAGIPGTMGGAAVMNAGAYGGEMKDILESVTVLTPEGEQKELNNEELQLGYRTSVVKEKGYIVLEAVLSLKKGDPEAIKSRMDELKEQRVTKQPLEYPSAGSTFKRPEGYFAGKLIQDAGLRGYQVGGAQVSEKHCGFVINKENATAKDVVDLIHDVQRIVYEKFQVQLETEVKFLGEF